MLKATTPITKITDSISAKIMKYRYLVGTAGDPVFLEKWIVNDSEVPLTRMFPWTGEALYPDGESTVNE